MSKIKILISGAGPAGLAIGSLLDRNKYEVTLVERGPKFMSMGFSIVLWKAGYDIMRKILNTSNIKGLYPLDVVGLYAGHKMHLVETMDTKGISYSIKREILVEQLANAYISRRGKNSVIFNAFIKDLTYVEDKAEVELSNGMRETYDLVIAADGMHSVLRSTFFKTELITKPYKITYCWIKHGAKLKDEAILGFMESCIYLIQTVGEDTLLTYCNKGDESVNDTFYERLSVMIKDKSGGVLDLDHETMQNFTSEELSVKDAFDRRLVLIGDAYHGHTPTLAMGTSMALEDAATLADIINSIPHAEYDDLITGKLKDYATKRESRIRKVYATQDLIENIVDTKSSGKLVIAEYLIKFGGWSIVEPLMRQIFSGSKS